MKLLLAAVAAAASVGAMPAGPARPPPAETPIRLAMVCMKTREETSGMNKICFYNCLGSEVAINIASTSLCPLTINR